MNTATDMRCRDCGAEGIRLYREYQTFLDHQSVLCTTCAELDEERCVDPHRPHQIGWRVAAVPDGEGSFWGYTSVPDDLVKWWNELPISR